MLDEGTFLEVESYVGKDITKSYGARREPNTTPKDALLNFTRFQTNV